MNTQTIRFYYKIKKPKLLENNVFVLFSPERLKFEPGQKKMVDMKLNITFPTTTTTDITGSCKLLLQLTQIGLSLQNCDYLSGNTDLHLEIFNSNMTQTIEIKSRGEIGYFIADCDQTEIKYEYVKDSH